jgi:hypothetical protein
MPKAYSLIYSTYCTTTMQARIEEHKDYESTIKNDPIKLLEAIQVLMQNPMRARYPFATMTDAFTKVLNYRQLEGQDLTDLDYDEAEAPQNDDDDDDDDVPDLDYHPNEDDPDLDDDTQSSDDTLDVINPSHDTACVLSSPEVTHVELVLE